MLTCDQSDGVQKTFLTGERRPKSYELGEDEVLCTKENQDGEEDETYGGLVDEEEEEEEPQDDDEDGPLSGSKRKASRIEV